MRVVVVVETPAEALCVLPALDWANQRGHESDVLVREREAPGGYQHLCRLYTLRSTHQPQWLAGRAQEFRQLFWDVVLVLGEPGALCKQLRPCVRARIVRWPSAARKVWQGISAAQKLEFLALPHACPRFDVEKDGAADGVMRLAERAAYATRVHGPEFFVLGFLGGASSLSEQVADRDRLRAANFNLLDRATWRESPPRPDIASRIPRLAHFCWLDTNDLVDVIPPAYEENVRQFRLQNPDFVTRVWTTRELKALWLKHKGASSLAWLMRVPRHICRCDMVRLLVVLTYGGLYVDLDFHFNRPVEPLLAQFHSSAVFPETVRNGHRRLCNGFFAFAPGHPWLARVLARIEANLAHRTSIARHRVLKLSGPGLWMQEYEATPVADRPELASKALAALVLPWCGSLGGRVVPAYTRPEPPVAYTTWVESTGWGDRYMFAPRFVDERQPRRMAILCLCGLLCLVCWSIWWSF